jgi:hypothetical protein
MINKAIVLDANILIRAVLGKRVRELIFTNALTVKSFDRKIHRARYCVFRCTEVFAFLAGKTMGEERCWNESSGQPRMHHSAHRP